MHTRLLTLLLAVLLALEVPIARTADSDYRDLVSGALSAIEWDFERSWAFTETSFSDESLRVGRFDPSQPVESRWSLLAFDNRQPTIEETEAFLEEKEGERLSQDSNGDDGLLDLVDIDSLELEKETDSAWLFSFTPTMGDDDDKFLKKVGGEIRILKDGPRVDYMNIRNTKPIRPIVGAKIKRMVMNFRFEPAVDGGPIVVKEITAGASGSAFLVVRFDEIETISFSDFEFVGDEASPPRRQDGLSGGR